jgi:arylsulfatase A-like enzyme
MKRITLRGLILLATAIVYIDTTSAQKAADKNKPNIILIMVDDMGYSDIGAYGSEIQTPNLDKLASEGLRFKEFYNNAICAPTRASLLTGQYPHRAGIGYFDVNLGLPAYQGFLNKESLTIGEVLRGAGYSTLLSGKWHVGNDSLSWPNQRGFDQFYGVIGGGANYFNNYPMPLFGRDYPVVLVENNKRLNPEPNSYYFTDEITNHAVTFLEEQNKTNKPFFLYVAYTAPHWPLHALPEDIAKYKGKYDKGWDELRKERYARQQQLGILDAQSKPAERDASIPQWDNLTYDEQKLWAARMEVYAAMVDRMDQGIGKIVAKLKQLKKDDNTLIVFISDNGAEGGNHTFGGRGKRLNSGPVGTAGSFDYVFKNWAHVSNTPLNSYKGNMHEGGISSPLIAWYPKRIKANTIAKGTGHLIDLAPTFYEVAGVKYPQQFKGITPHALPGKSLVPVFTSSTQQVSRTEPIFWERAGNRAVRKGKWKLVADHQKAWELYDLEADRGETTDLSVQHPEVVRELAFDYTQWAARTGVVEYETIKPKNAPGAPAETKQPASRSTN